MMGKWSPTLVPRGKGVDESIRHRQRPGQIASDIHVYFHAQYDLALQLTYSIAVLGD